MTKGHLDTKLTDSNESLICKSEKRAVGFSGTLLFRTSRKMSERKAATERYVAAYGRNIYLDQRLSSIDTLVASRVRAPLTAFT